MTIRGSCLCGDVVFEIQDITGPFEICHCSRCRKVSGAAGIAMIAVARDGFRFVSGKDQIRRFEAPLLEKPPQFAVHFCRRCGSPLPNPEATGEILEVPAGLLDDDPGLRPDKHIYVDLKADWDVIVDDTPQFTRDEIREHRRSSRTE